MQEAIPLEHRGLTLRGMRHWPTQDVTTTPARVPAVVLLHSFTSQKSECHRMYVTLSRMLVQQGIASFRFDFLGSGESDGDFVDMTISGEVEEAHAILEMVRRHPGVDPSCISIVGFSMGGLVAGAVAGDVPDAVHKLALLAPAGNMKTWAMKVAEEMGPEQRIGIGFDYGGHLIGEAFARDVMTIDPYARSAPYKGPVLLVHGTEDGRVPAEVIERYQSDAYAGRAIIHSVEGANHTFDSHAWEQDVLQRVVSFLV